MRFRIRGGSFPTSSISCWAPRIPTSAHARRQLPPRPRALSKEQIENHVILQNRFVELKELTEFIGAADLYITPYLASADYSGTLGYAFRRRAKPWFRRRIGTRRIVGGAARFTGAISPTRRHAREGERLLRDGARRHAMSRYRLPIGPRDGVEQDGGAVYALLRDGAAEGAGGDTKTPRLAFNEPTWQA